MRFEFRKAHENPKAWDYQRVMLTRDGRFLTEHSLVKGKIKGHYRKLPNGKTVWIDSYFNKRKKKFTPDDKHRVVHADEDSTSMVNHKGEVETYSHKHFNELSQDDIHSKLNSAMTVDDNLAFKMWKHKRGIKDYDKFLNDLVADEKKKSDKTGADPEFTNKKDAHTWVMNSKPSKKNPEGFQGVKHHLKELQDKYGDVTTYANAYNHTKHDDFKKYTDAVAGSKPGEHKDEEFASAKMTSEHAKGAEKALEQEQENIAQAQKMKPEDCPMIPGLSKNTELFGHQAQSLAALNVLTRAILDVDMGGGKGLILPADALNLMGQGKVKKPLIVVPGATLEQNASKIHEYTEGGVNVFLINNSTVKDHYDGDLTKMVEAIQDAPENTIFMASYDVFSYQDRSQSKDEDGEEKSDTSENEQFPRAAALGAAGFDYVALDEAHNIKNPNTARFKSMKHLTHAKYKRVASGTFLSNNPVDVLGQQAFLNPHNTIDEAEFSKRYGKKETAEGTEWTGLKSLRQDLLDQGMISLRRSAWIDKLPERKEALSVSKMEKAHAAIYNSVLDDVIEQLEEEMKSNPRMKKFFADDGLGEMDDLPPQALAKLSLVGGIVDHPHEMAEMMDEKIKTVKDAQKEGDVDEETQAVLESLMKMKSETRKSIRALRGMVSPKAKDVYKKIDEHFANKKNGKYVVFVQRKASAAHIIANMPEHQKKMSVYYDASKKDELKSFLEDPNGPKVIVAVDASIKEGVNMQVANGMYRYDHHWSPGNQEQSYARIWRFGQDKPTNFSIGVTDGSMDVPKYARLQTKLHQNMQVVSDFEDATTPYFKMNLDTLKSKNDAGILPQYVDLGKKILAHQHEENKGLKKRFGKGTFKRSSGKKLKGELQHGIGPYHSDIKENKLRSITDEEGDKLIHAFREQMTKHFKDEKAPFDQDIYDEYLDDVHAMLLRHNAKGGGEKMDKGAFDRYIKEKDQTNSDRDPTSEKEKKFLWDTMNQAVSGKKPPAKAAYHNIDHPLDLMLKKHNFKGVTKDAKKFAKEDAEFLLKEVGDKHLGHVSGGDVEFPEVADAAFKKLEKKAGEKLSPKYRKLLLGVAGMTQEVRGGWKAIKDAYDFADVGEGDDE